MRRRLALFGAVLALAGVAAGCGGDDASEEDATAAWASDFCSAITAWTDELQTVTSELSDPANLSQDALQSAAEDVQSATETLVDDLRNLGAPETEGGDDVRSSLNGLSATLESESDKIEHTVDGISGITELPTAITAITTSLSTMGAAFASALQTIQDADVGEELQSALEDSPECADISSS